MSAHEHLSDDVLIDGLYGLADGAEIETDIDECPLCASRWSEIRQKHAGLAVCVETGADVLAAQRRSIYRRIEHPSLWERASRWAAPVVATAACLLAIGVFVHRPDVVQRTSGEIPLVIPVAISDAQLYSDVYSMEQSFEPSASASIGVLFEPDASAGDGDRSAK